MSEAIQGKSDTRYPKAQSPTMYFVGVTTGASSAPRMFPAWAKRLGCPDAHLVGVDFQVGDEPAAYRNLVQHILEDPLSLGALVTTHKIDLLDASADLFGHLEPAAATMGEVASIYKRDNVLHGDAPDTDNAMRAIRRFLPQDHWQLGVHAFVIGAGGSSVAIVCGLLDGDGPKRIVVSDTNADRLDRARAIHQSVADNSNVIYCSVAGASDNDRIVGSLPSGSVVINATGLGKDAPGSPLSDTVEFPEGAFAWDLNYRGQLRFLDQARSAQVHAVDGWAYFLFGWVGVVSEVLNRPVPEDGSLFDDLATAAEAIRD
jgi:shikimate 5-dehydrogenase